MLGSFSSKNRTVLILIALKFKKMSQILKIFRLWRLSAAPLLFFLAMALDQVNGQKCIPKFYKQRTHINNQRII